MPFSVIPLLILSAAPASFQTGAKQLAIVKPALRQYEDGPELPPTFSFLTGESVFLTFQIAGYQASGGDTNTIDLRCRIDALDPDGVKLVETASREIKTPISAEDKNWTPIVRHTFVIPPLALPGRYKLVLSVQDVLGKRDANTELPFNVRGHKVEPSPTLTARNFRFLRSEEDQDPLETAAYRPGDTLWARFDMIGFKYGEKNRIHVEYGLAVLGPTGKELYAEPRAAVEEGESFYPKKYVPGVLSLNLSKAQPGEYTIVLTLRDEVGSQMDESRHTFKVEK